MRLVVTANEYLFNRFKELAISIDQLKGIVQNDIHISQRQFATWRRQAKQIENEYRVLIERTINHVLDEN